MASSLTTPITVYGIAHCDTVKKARAWLQEHQVAYEWHDFKKQGVPADRLDAWLQQLGRDALINRRGTTWRRLDAAVQARITDDASAKALMLEQHSVIKRPLVDWGRAGSRWDLIRSSGSNCWPAHQTEPAWVGTGA